MDFIKTFADILKAMLYRLLRSRMTLVFILILVISIMCGIAALKAIGANTALSADMSATSSDITLGLSVLAADASGVDFARACGMLFVRGSFIAMMMAVFCGVFFASDLRSGTVKNVIIGCTGRTAYMLAAGVCTLMITAFAVLVGVMISLAALIISGFAVAVKDCSSKSSSASGRYISTPYTGRTIEKKGATSIAWLCCITDDILNLSLSPTKLSFAQIH